MFIAQNKIAMAKKEELLKEKAINEVLLTGNCKKKIKTNKNDIQLRQKWITKALSRYKD